MAHRAVQGKDANGWGEDVGGGAKAQPGEEAIVQEHQERGRGNGGSVEVERGDEGRGHSRSPRDAWLSGEEVGVAHYPGIRG